MTARAAIALRESLGLTQEALARRLRVATHTVSNWEQGVRKIRAPMALMLETLAREAKPAEAKGKSDGR